MTAERRAQSRVVTDLKVRIDGVKGRQNVIARDLSASGVFVETLFSYQRGQMLELRLELPDDAGKRRLDINTEVRHISNAYHTEDGRGPYRGVGLRFVRMDADVQSFLNRFLQSNGIG